MNKLKASAEFIQSEARKALTRGREDVGKLSDLGFTAKWFDTFEQEIRETETMLDHRGHVLELNELTDAKDSVLNACAEWAGRLRLRLGYRYGTNSRIHRRFPSKALNAARFSESQMMPLMESLIKIATKHAAKLEEVGQTPEKLTEGTELLQALRRADAVQEDKKAANLAATQERIVAHQNLYDKVNQINRAGRFLFAKDPTRRVLYRSPWHKYQNAEPETESNADGESADDSAS